jgi:hypothetical protein
LEERLVTDTPREVQEPGTDTPAMARPGRRRWQVGLRSLFLLMAAIAVWMAYFINLRHNATLRTRIAAMIPIAHELVIEDASKIAAVKLEPYWYDENRWGIYLPDASFRLCIATRGVDEKGLAEVVKSAPIGGGRHQLELETTKADDVWRVRALWDAKELLAVEEPKDWKPGGGSIGGGYFSVGEQISPDQPAVLFRRRFLRKERTGVAPTSGPTEGILLWIERADASKLDR